MEFLLVAVVVGAIGIAIVLWRNREPRGLHGRLTDFRRGVDALAPDDGEGSRSQTRRPRPPQPGREER